MAKNRGLFCDCEPWRTRRPSPPPCRCWRASLPVEPARPERAPGAPSGDVHLVLLSSAQPDLSSAGAAHKNLLLTMTTQDEQDDRPRRWRRCRRVPGERCTARAPHTHLARAPHTRTHAPHAHHTPWALACAGCGMTCPDALDHPGGEGAWPHAPRVMDSGSRAQHPLHDLPGHPGYPGGEGACPRALVRRIPCGCTPCPSAHTHTTRTATHSTRSTYHPSCTHPPAPLAPPALVRVRV